MIKRFLSTVRSFPINITDNALFKMSKIIESKGNYSFLFSAVGGGCNGLNFNLKLIDNDEFKKLFDKSKIKPNTINKNNVKLTIDPMSEMFLLGTTIDYVSENYDKGIFENKFIFVPDKKLATTCGCGVSFTPKH